MVTNGCVHYAHTPLLHVKRRRRVSLAERVFALDALARRASGLACTSARRARRERRAVELVTAAMAAEAVS